MKTKQQKQKEAAARKLAHARRGYVGQLAKLENAGHGHCDEACSLREWLEDEGQS